MITPEVAEKIIMPAYDKVYKVYSKIIKNPGDLQDAGQEAILTMHSWDSENLFTGDYENSIKQAETILSFLMAYHLVKAELPPSADLNEIENMPSSERTILDVLVAKEYVSMRIKSLRMMFGDGLYQVN